MKRILMVAGCVVIVAMAAFAGTNQVAGAAQDKEDVRDEVRREREAQRKALEKIQGELKRQREERTAKVGRETHVDELLDLYADRTGKTILRDPSVPNTVIKFNLRDEKKFTKEEFPGVLETVLEMNGVHLEPFGEKLVNAFPSRLAASKGVPLIMTPKRLEEKGRIVSMMVPFKNISVKEASRALEAYKSVAGLFVIYERTNSIVITDVDKNINRMQEIAKAIDVAPFVTDCTFVRQMKFAKVQDIMSALSALTVESTKDAWTSARSASEFGSGQSPTLFQAKSGKKPGLLKFKGKPTSVEARQDSQEKVAVPKRSEALCHFGMPDANCGAIQGRVLLFADFRTGKLIVITSKANMDFFDKVIAELDVEAIPAQK